MSEVTIDQARYEQLQAASDLLLKLNSPKTRRLLTQAVKEHYPDTQTDEDIAAEFAKPHLEKLESLTQSVQERLSALDAREAKAKEQSAVADMEAAFNRLRTQQGYNDDGIRGIKELMVDRSIPDPEAAAALFDRLHPPVQEGRSSWEPDNYNFREDAVANDVKGLFADPDRWADIEVGKVLMELRS